MSKDNDRIAPDTEPRLEIVTPGPSPVPNFVHVGQDPHALEGYLRLYVREWTQNRRPETKH